MLSHNGYRRHVPGSRCGAGAAGGGRIAQRVRGGQLVVDAGVRHLTVVWESVCLTHWLGCPTKLALPGRVWLKLLPVFAGGRAGQRAGGVVVARLGELIKRRQNARHWLLTEALVTYVRHWLPRSGRTRREKREEQGLGI